MARTALLDIPELLSPEAQRRGMIEQYGSVIEPVEPTFTDRVRNFVYDTTMRFGGNRGSALRRAGMAEDVIGVSPLQGITDYQLAKRAYTEGDSTGGDINMLMAAASLLPGNERQLVSGFSKAGDEISGLRVGDRIKNQGSISATFDDGEYDILEGVREIPLSEFDITKPGELFYAKNDIDRARKLAEEIKNNQYLDPLIVVRDDEGMYVLEGAHRLGAASELGLDSVPAQVVDARTDRTMPPTPRSALNDLDMSYDARMQRADQMGMTTPAYSGSTHDISSFRGDISNPENDWGRGTYASTSIDDVNANYAGVGPDLTGRIQTESERVADALYDYPDELLSEHGFTLEDYNRDEAGVAEAIARKMLVGDAEGGIVYPLRINTEKYAVIGGPNSTTLDVDLSGTKGLDPDSDEYYEALNEASGDLYQKVYDAISDTDAYQATYDIEMVMSDVSEYLADGQLDLSDLDYSIRRHIRDAYDEYTGRTVSPGGISAQVLKNLGYEGVIDNTVNTKFGTGRSYGQSMAGVNPDTQHIITFPGYESRIRSTYAAFDPSKKSSRDILAGITGGSLIGGSALSGQRQENNN